LAAPGSNGEWVAKNLIHHGDTENTEENTSSRVIPSAARNLRSGNTGGKRWQWPRDPSLRSG
jgi:hypothetical protein